MFTLAVFFSKSQWRRTVSDLLFYSSVFSFCSDVDGVICCQNLYQQQTIIVNLANVYKVQSIAAGLCSVSGVLLLLLFIFLPVFYVFVSVLRVSI